MKNKNLIRIAQALVIFPALSMNLPVGSVPNTEAPRSVLVQQINMEAPGFGVFNKDNDPEAVLEAKGEAIDAYFKKYGMPLLGKGRKMAEEAEKNGLDWRLIAAISVRESTGGKFECQKVPNNAFGWGSCKIGFKSEDEAIEIVAKNLGGNNPRTASHYAGKNTRDILKAYNPPSIVPKYSEQVISIMENIGPEILGNVSKVSAS